MLFVFISFYLIFLLTNLNTISIVHRINRSLVRRVVNFQQSFLIHHQGISFFPKRNRYIFGQPCIRLRLQLNGERSCVKDIILRYLYNQEHNFDRFVPLLTHCSIISCTSSVKSSGVSSRVPDSSFSTFKILPSIWNIRFFYHSAEEDDYLRRDLSEFFRIAFELKFENRFFV